MRRIAVNKLGFSTNLSTGKSSFPSPALIQKELGASYGDALLIEPAARCTAPAIALGLKYLLEKCAVSGKEVCVVCPSDLYFEKEEDLLALLPLAEEEAQKGRIVTLGIKPSYPETGYGYIKAGEGKEIFPVERFVEKPNLLTAIRLIEEGSYYWNAGIFIFQIEHFLKELRKHAPDFSSWLDSPYKEAIKNFSSLPTISIDHALMEKTESLSLIPYPSVWSDLGSWERLLPLLPKDAQGNFLSGNLDTVDTKNSMIFGDDIITLGIEDLIIVKVGEKVVVASKKELKRLPELSSLSRTKTY